MVIKYILSKKRAKNVWSKKLSIIFQLITNFKKISEVEML